jgi:hypothetical protein
MCPFTGGPCVSGPGDCNGGPGSCHTC